MRLFIQRKSSIVDAMILEQQDGSGLSIAYLTEGTISKERFHSKQEIYRFLENSMDVIGFCEVPR